MREEKPSLRLLWVMVAAFALLFAALAMRRHAALETNALDLGNVNQALWNTAHGDFLAFTNMYPVRNRLALHVEPVLLLFVPFYWAGLGGPRLLLALQAVVVALGALPAYLLARRHLPGAGDLPLLAFPLAYLLLPSLEAAVMYDFHAVTLAPTFLLFAFYFMRRERAWPFAIFAALAASCKEDMALPVMMMGFYAALFEGKRSRGLVTAALGAAWFVAAVFVVQPRFSPVGGNVQMGRYAWLADSWSSPAAIWEHLWGRVDLLSYLGALLLPMGFLPLLDPLSLAIAAPSFAVNLLSENPFTWRPEDFHYAAPIAPFLLISAILGAERLSRLAENRGIDTKHVPAVLCAALLCCSLGYHHVRGFTPLAAPFRWQQVGRHEWALEGVMQLIPPDAPLFAQSNLNPHLSGRRTLYADLSVLADDTTDDADFVPPEYLLFDLATLPNENDVHAYIRDVLPKGDTKEGYGVVYAADGYLLMRRGAGSPGFPGRLYNFARFDGPGSSIQYEVTADFGGAVQLVGYDLLFNRAEEVQPVLHMKNINRTAGADGDSEFEYRVFFYLLDDDGSPLGATEVSPAATTWYPPGAWREDETVRIRAGYLPWYTRGAPPYRLATAVSTSPDPWDAAARLPVGGVGGDYAVRLWDDGTLLELGRIENAAGMPRGGASPRRYAAPRPARDVEADFAGSIRLRGYDLSVEDGGLALTLYWQALRRTPEDYTVFLHVLDSSGSVVAQRDSPPLGGSYPTSLWYPGESVVDVVHVPLDAPPDGAYTCRVGLYLPVPVPVPETGERAVVYGDDARPEGDYVDLECTP